MSIFALPSLLALIIKLWLFKVAGRRLFLDNPMLAFFLCSLLGMNINEFGYYAFANEATVLLPVLLLFYITVVYAVAAYFLMVIDMLYPVRFVKTGLLSVATLLAMVTATTDLVIADAVRTDYSITRVAGEFYWVMQAYLLVLLVGGLFLLARGALKNTQSMIRKRCLAILLGTSPVILTGIGILAAIQLGFEPNGALILSLMTTVTLILLIYIESRYRLFLFLSYVPYTRERQIRKAVTDLVAESVEALFKSGGALDMKAVSGKFESALIEMAIEATGGNKTHAAEVLQIGKATLHRKLVKA